MTDKVQKIREEVERLQDACMDEEGNIMTAQKQGAYHVLCNLDAFIDSLQEEPVSEDLEEAASRYAKEEYNRKNPATLPDRCRGCYAPLMYAFKAGAQWQEENLWKSAEGSDLPIFDREVIVLTQHYPLENSEYAVSFAHRPNPKGWDGLSITTRKVEHYTPKTYDKGGWNIPNIVYWLDVELPKEIEL